MQRPTPAMFLWLVTLTCDFLTQRSEFPGLIVVALSTPIWRLQLTKGSRLQMEINNHTLIESPEQKSAAICRQFLIHWPSSILSYISTVTPYPFPVKLLELPDENGRDLGIAGWENMRMGFKFQMGMGWGWKNGMELVRKICSRTSLV